MKTLLNGRHHNPSGIFHFLQTCKSLSVVTQARQVKLVFVVSMFTTECSHRGGAPMGCQNWGSQLNIWSYKEALPYLMLKMCVQSQMSVFNSKYKGQHFCLRVHKCLTNIFRSHFFRWREVLTSSAPGHMAQMNALVLKYPEVAEVKK